VSVDTIDSPVSDQYINTVASYTFRQYGSPGRCFELKPRNIFRSIYALRGVAYTEINAMG